MSAFSKWIKNFSLEGFSYLLYSSNYHNFSRAKNAKLRFSLGFSNWKSVFVMFSACYIIVLRIIKTESWMTKGGLHKNLYQLHKDYRLSVKVGFGITATLVPKLTSYIPPCYNRKNNKSAVRQWVSIALFSWRYKKCLRREKFIFVFFR